MIAGWSFAAAPPPLFTVSTWADEKRRLPETSAARGARWLTDEVPYLRGIMDAVHEPGVRQIALMKGSQIGGSEALHNIIGYFIEHDPCPILLVHPTAQVAAEWSKDRLSDMLRSTPALGDVVREKRGKRGSHDPESTLNLKMFPGGFLVLGGANTPNTFSRRAVRLALGDDVDRFPPIVGEEGDPADLLINRTTTFHDALVIFVSTPTLKSGRIDTLYTRSDQRRFMVPCPVCRREDWITWSDLNHFRVTFDDRDPDTARLECPDEDHGGCGALLFEPDRRTMIAAGEWQATTTAKEFGLVGFHLPSMYSTLGAVSLSSLVAKWLGAREKGKESLRVFINTTLAEGWEDRGARMDPQSLLGRREDYGELLEGDAIEAPEGVALLTAGVDVQEDRVELQVTGWGLASQRWVVDYRALPGDHKQPEVWAALLQALARRYVNHRGHQLPILSTCIDSGFATDQVYDFVLAHQGRRIFATKGFAGRSGEPIVGKPSDKRWGKAPRPVRLYPINVDDAKGDILGALSVLQPGPGAIRFPLRVDTIHEEYFAQLCAEHRETRYNRAGVATHTVWVQDRDRNEALDTAVLCLAAFRLLNPNIRQMLERLAATPPPQTPEPVPEGGTPAPPAQPAVPGRRISHSTYLRR